MEKTFLKLNEREFKVVETTVVEKTVDYKEVMSQKEKLLSEQEHEDRMRADMIADFDRKKADRDILIAELDKMLAFVEKEKIVKEEPAVEEIVKEATVEEVVEK